MQLELSKSVVIIVAHPDDETLWAGGTILSGMASPTRANDMISWIESECEHMKQNGELAVDLPPNFFPYTKPEDADWRPRYAQFNNPGEYHNGGIWPFIAGFYLYAAKCVEECRTPFFDNMRR